MRAHDTTLRRSRTFFIIALLTLCTTFFSYERIKSSAFSLFQEPVIHNNGSLTNAEKQIYKGIFDKIGPMDYGTAHRPPMKGAPKNIIAALPDKLVPALPTDEDDDETDHVKRLVIIGDVHGHKAALQDLLHALNFDSATDSLIFTGDLVNKGPDSAGVVELAMELGAYSVRGNHEDRVLLTHEALTAPPFVAESDIAIAALEKFRIKDDQDKHPGKDQAAALEEYQEGEHALSKGDKRAREVARSLSPEQIKWLSDLPVVLEVGPIPRRSDHPAFENLLVVHAGLVPNVALENQDPWAVMNMRTLSHPVDELRRDAVRKVLTERAKRRPGSMRGKLAALQAVDDLLVDQELQRILDSKGPEDKDGEVTLPSSGRDGTYWYEEWSRFQEKLVKQSKKADKEGEDVHEKHKKKENGPVTTVVYGHDAKSGLRVPDTFGKGKKGYTFGLDSGCVYGGQLTALVIEVIDGQAVHNIVQVDCEQQVAPDKD